MKKLFCLFLSLVLLLSVAGCGNREPEEKPSEQETTTVPDVTDTPDTTTLPEPTLEEGWWTLTEDRDDLPYAIAINTDGSWSSYDRMGEIFDSGTYILRGTALTLNTDYSQMVLYLRDSGLCEQDASQPLYVKASEPDFSEQENISLDGRWYLDGSEHSDLFFEFYEDQFQLISLENGSPEILSEGTYEAEYTQMVHDDYRIPEVPIVNCSTDDLVLFPIPDEGILFADDYSEVALFVSYEDLDPDMIPIYNQMTRLMNGQLIAQQDDMKYVMSFQPYCFYISVYQVDSDGYEERLDEDIFGQWSFFAEDRILLEYENDSWETVTLSDTLSLDNIGLKFEFQPDEA